MSVAFASARPRGKGEVTQQTIQKMLDENHHLIQCILDYQSKGKTAECTQYQQILHRNLVYLATIADSNQNMQSLLPAPPTQNMNLGPGALSQSSSSQGLHSQGSLSDAVGTGLPPASLMQGQIGNGPNHVSMQQTAQSTLPTTSMSMSGSGHGSGPGYSHSGPASQSVPLQGQGAIGNYVSRANISMQSNPVSMMHQQAASSHYNSAQGGSQHYQGQSSIAMMGQSGQGSSMMGQRPMAPYRPSQQGSSQQYLGQEEYYAGEQYGHGQAASEPMGQQYYPDGHGDYAYQQSSYTEQSYDRSFEESTQHYYEGGNSQYSQQQAGYQQGTAQQQAGYQQQYPNQQSYPGQQQGYGPAQGAASQYSGYQQGQGQQYGSYRASQTGPSAQQQRPYGYEQARPSVSVETGPRASMEITSSKEEAALVRALRWHVPPWLVGLVAVLMNSDLLIALRPHTASACEACTFHAGRPVDMRRRPGRWRSFFRRCPRPPAGCGFETCPWGPDVLTSSSGCKALPWCLEDWDAGCRKAPGARGPRSCQRLCEQALRGQFPFSCRCSPLALWGSSFISINRSGQIRLICEHSPFSGKHPVSSFFSSQSLAPINCL
ncbi:calcium-responsive transactivator isoform X2 [Mirounga angustirostris]|uniref:calcium-responsive transactivator isoform X2 n=1 Tax=Mirounga angustirostris TaxID=9716 RepID=UPI00313D81A0